MTQKEFKEIMKDVRGEEFRYEDIVNDISGYFFRLSAELDRQGFEHASESFRQDAHKLYDILAQRGYYSERKEG